MYNFNPKSPEVTEKGQQTHRLIQLMNNFFTRFLGKNIFDSRDLVNLKVFLTFDHEKKRCLQVKFNNHCKIKF